jgi:hypothetical protein
VHQTQMHLATQSLAMERQASAQAATVTTVSRSKTPAILGLMWLNFLSVSPGRLPRLPPRCPPSSASRAGRVSVRRAWFAGAEGPRLPANAPHRSGPNSSGRCTANRRFRGQGASIQPAQPEPRRWRCKRPLSRRRGAASSTTVGVVQGLRWAWRSWGAIVQQPGAPRPPFFRHFLH